MNFLKWIMPVLIAGHFAGCAGIRTKTVPPIKAGPYAVAGSNVRLHPDKLKEVKDLFTILNGAHGDDGDVYLYDLLESKETAFTFSLSVPENAALYGDKAGHIIPSAGMLLYPTDTDNNDLHYGFSVGGFRIPHMQADGEKPKISGEQEKYPLIIYSHGYTANPLYHLPAMEKLASHGYIVLALFHGDNRFKSILNTNHREIQQLTLRILALKQSIEILRQRKEFADRIDFSKIGAIGVSFGGSAIAGLAGGAVNTGSTLETIVEKPEVHAVVGIVPSFALAGHPTWGEHFAGIQGISIPFLAIAGEADQLVPFPMVKSAVEAMSGERFLTAMPGVGHGFTPAMMEIMDTLSVAFFDWYLKADSEEPGVFAQIAKVETRQDMSITDYPAKKK